MKKFKWLILSLVIILIIKIPIFAKFTITNGRNNKIILIESLDEFQYFNLTFIHSVNKTPVKEYYRIEGDKFVLYKAEFSSYGAGMSDGSDFEEAKISYGEGGEIFLDLQEEFESITYYVGTIAQHTLYSKNRKVELIDLLEAKSPAIFKVEKLSIMDILEMYLLKNKKGLVIEIIGAIK